MLNLNSAMVQTCRCTVKLRLFGPLNVNLSKNVAIVKPTGFYCTVRRLANPRRLGRRRRRGGIDLD